MTLCSPERASVFRVLALWSSLLVLPWYPGKNWAQADFSILYCQFFVTLAVESEGVPARKDRGKRKFSGSSRRGPAENRPPGGTRRLSEASSDMTTSADELLPAAAHDGASEKTAPDARVAQMLGDRLLQGLAHVQALTADVAEATELLGDEVQTPEDESPAAELLDPQLRPRVSV